MMDWTDRHCRFFHRQITHRAWLYTEMVTTGALLHGDVGRHLDFDAVEQPLALQLGGSDPGELAQCARLGERWGYQEINLNCGCPSERVQRGAFGACLMAEPQLVGDCVKAMLDSVSVPVTVKHRIGIDNGANRFEDYGFVRDFVGTLADSGCKTFIVHARSAWLKGLSPKENREVPPLRYDTVYRIKREFPDLEIILNGGLAEEQIASALLHVDGVMLGREAYHNPYSLAEVDRRWYGGADPVRMRDEVVDAMIEYAAAQITHGVRLRSIARHMLGLYQGRPGARAWRRHLSDSRALDGANASLLREALRHVEAAGE